MDTFFAVPFLSLGAVALIGASSMDHDSAGGDWSGLARAVGVVFVVIGGIYAGSAAYGFSATSECTARRGRRPRQRTPVGEMIACTSDRDCQPSRICNAGACTAPECTTDFDCSRALYCINGRCE